jgi:hypothetical protein
MFHHGGTEGTEKEKPVGIMECWNNGKPKRRILVRLFPPLVFAFPQYSTVPVFQHSVYLPLCALCVSVVNIAL